MKPRARRVMKFIVVSRQVKVVMGSLLKAVKVTSSTHPRVVLLRSQEWRETAPVDETPFVVSGSLQNGDPHETPVDETPVDETEPVD